MRRIILSLSLLIFGMTGESQTEKILSPEQMQRDLDILHSAWISLHPGIYRYNAPGKLEGYFDDLLKLCSVPTGERTFYIRLAQLAEKIKCGHTYLNPLNLSDSVRLRVLPAAIIPVFFVVTPGNKIIVTHNLSDNTDFERGDEIISINIIPSRRIIDSLLSVSRSDGNHSKGKKLNNINETPDEASNHSLFDIFFPLFFPIKNDQFNLLIKSYKTGLVKTHTVSATSLNERMKRYEEAFGKVPVDEKSWDYRLLNRQTAYMKFGTFAFWNSSFNTKKYIDSIFQNLLRQPIVKNLVIDIRNNEGGDNSGDYILSYITSKKPGCDDPDHRCYRYLRVPDSLLGYLSTWDASFKKPKDPSLFFVNDIGLYESKTTKGDCDFIIPQANRFKGKVFLITDAKNSSAGYEMARNFKSSKLGLVIGETTGGSQQGINGGEFFFLTLPNSKFEIDLPLIYNYHPNKPDRGIDPDYAVPTTQKDIATNKDPQLEFILKLISKSY